eukprot:761118-Hanusia_phi.AAC.5
MDCNGQVECGFGRREAAAAVYPLLSCLPLHPPSSILLPLRPSTPVLFAVPFMLIVVVPAGSCSHPPASPLHIALLVLKIVLIKIWLLGQAYAGRMAWGDSFCALQCELSLLGLTEMGSGKARKSE